MAPIDISREAFDPKKHYSSVRMQQGRIFLDDDWNEGEHIENEDRRRARVDIVGPCGSPDQGFLIKDPRFDGDSLDFDILPGTFYLGGIRLEMEPVQGKPETYRMQRDWLQKETQDSDKKPGSKRYDLVYLEAWQQPVSAVEDDELFEVALGLDGPDTSVRIRNMRRVRIEPGVDTPDCAREWQKLRLTWEYDCKGRIDKENRLLSNATLTVTYNDEENQENLCKPSIKGGYLGAENQSIRVQLVDYDHGTGEGHITWGFDNASPLYRVEVSTTGLSPNSISTVKMLSEPRDEAHWPLAGQTVEILPWSAVLSNGEKIADIKGHLSSVKTSYKPDKREFILTDSLESNFGEEWLNRSDNAELSKPSKKQALRSQTALYYFMRVWNRGADLESEPEISFKKGEPITLGKTGLDVTIDGDCMADGDYWIIAARPETPNITVPWAFEKGLPPNGICRFYAPLAIIQWNPNPIAGEKEGDVIRDCRKTFRPLTDLETCCTYSVGDGLHTYGDFNAIEDAIQNLPLEGGKICVLPGVHTANIKLKDRKNIHIIGCGMHTIIRPRPLTISEPIFYISSCYNIRLDNMTLMTEAGTAIHIKDLPDASKASQKINIEHNNIEALVNAIRVEVNNGQAGNNDICIAHNQIGMLDLSQGEVAIFSNADDVLIEQNRIVVVPAPAQDIPDDTRDPAGPSGVIFDDCIEPAATYGMDFDIHLYSLETFAYVGTIFPKVSRKNYLAEGGIQIAGGSERVKIISNEIIGGRGNGIGLGYIPLSVVNESREYRSFLLKEKLTGDTIGKLKEELPATLYAITIEGNSIQDMGLSGIGTAAFLSLENIGLMFSIHDLIIYRNTITGCAQQIPDNVPAGMLDQVGFGGIALPDCENVVMQENRVEDNGSNHFEPVCGVFIASGESVDISNNRILNNGPRVSPDDANIKIGLRGGIVVLMSLKKLTEKIFDDRQLISPDGVPAVKIHGNIVAQPLGQALIILAYGPVSVVGNHLTSQEADFRVNPLSLLAGTVFILNLGVSKDAIVRALSSTQFRSLAMAGYSSKASSPAVVAGLYSSTMDMWQKLLLLPSGTVLFSDNRVILELRNKESNIALSSQLIASLDDVAYNNNQAECAAWIDFATKGGKLSLMNMDIVIADALIAATTIRTNDNRFQEGITQVLYSLFSRSMMNTATGNQATHCLHILGDMVSKDNNLVIYNTECDNDSKKYQKYYGMMQDDGVVITSKDEAVFQKIDNGFAALDTKRAEGLNKAMLVQNSKITNLEMEKKRLTVKYGADSPIVGNISSKLDSSLKVTEGLKLEVDKANIEMDVFDPKTWKAHGRVLDKNGTGIENLTVSVFDKENNWVKQLGYTCTDDKGYFALVYSPEDGQQVPDSQDLSLTVTGEEHTIICQDNTPFQVKIGREEYRDIVIPTEGGICPPPAPENKPPVAIIEILTAENLRLAGVPIEFDGSKSHSFNDNALTYKWDFGDGTASTEKKPRHTYDKGGKYTVTLVVNDGKADSVMDSTSLNIANKGHTITAKTSGNGTISPSGAVKVVEGASQNFTMKPADGHHIEDVRVDGDSVGILLQYLFKEVKSDHTIEAIFKPDNVGGPIISDMIPKGDDVNNATPTISAKYSDPSGVGIELKSVILKLNGATIADAQIKPDMVSYTPAKPLNSETTYYAEVSVSNKAGVSSEAEWSFSLENKPPRIINEEPTGTVIFGDIRISADYSDDGTGIEPSTAIMKFNGQLVKAATSSSTIKYVERLNPGNYDVYVEVCDRAGNKASKEWKFIVTRTDKPVLKLSTEELAFGEIRTQNSFTILNAGIGVLSWKSSSRLPWVKGILPSNGLLSSGESAKVTVEISRAGMEQGEYIDNIIISSNDGDGKLKVSMIIRPR